MIKVTVKNIQGEIRNQAQFETEGEANTWIASNESIKAFGKPERWVHEDDLEFMGEDKTQAVSSEDIEVPEGFPAKKRYKFAAQYTVETQDITAEVEAVRKIQRRMSKQSFGAYLLAKITELNRSKNYTVAQFGQIMADTSLMTIERLLYSGSLDLAKTMIQGYQGAWYTVQEKADLIAEIDAWFAANPGA